MKRTGPGFRALVNRATETGSRLPWALVRLAVVIGLPACCCFVGIIHPMLVMNALKPKLEDVCAHAVVGQPVAVAEAYARRQPGLIVYAVRPTQGLRLPPGTLTTTVSERRSPVTCYCFIDHVDGVVRSARTYVSWPGD